MKPVKGILIGIISLLIIALVVLGISTTRTYLSSANEDSVPTGVQVKVGEDGKSATVSFTTAKPAMPKVEYGTTPSSMLLGSLLPDIDSTTHSVNLVNLKPSQSYFFTIRIGEQVYDNGGIPYSFKTKDVGTSVIPTVVLAKPTTASAVPSPVVATGSATPIVCNLDTDYDGNGKVEIVDYGYCRQNGSTIKSNPTPTPKTVCNLDTDYDKDGQVSALDYIKCVQDSKAAL